jgi:hypothetical protein
MSPHAASSGWSSADQTRPRVAADSQTKNGEGARRDGRQVSSKQLLVAERGADQTRTVPTSSQRRTPMEYPQRSPVNGESRGRSLSCALTAEENPTPQLVVSGEPSKNRTCRHTTAFGWRAGTRGDAAQYAPTWSGK